jgi:hypothetical protein
MNRSTYEEPPMTERQKRRDNLFSFTRNAKPSRKDTVDRAELEEALASVLEAIERLAAKVDALTGEGARHGG